VTLAIGTRIGPYEIVAPLGAGGMGEVWRARDTKLGREVALKLLPSEFVGDPERHARFEREAKVLASLNHPHIATLYGLEHVDGRHALVMELVEGEGLDERIARGALPVDEAIPIAVQIAEALEAAHEKGIVHRDLKPANVKVRPNGTVKVLDFGLARAWDEPVEDLDPAHSPTVTGVYTRAGVLLGTVAYMAPEQARGKQVDKRADIWAFGCVLYEMLCGVPAYGGDTVADAIAAIVTRDPEWDRLPAGLAAPVVRVLRRCLERDPKRRVRDIGDARLEIEEVTSAVSAPPVVGPRQRTMGWLPWLLVAATAATALLVGRLAIRRRAEGSAPRPVRLAVSLPPGIGLEYEQENQQQVVAIAPDGSRVAFIAATGTETKIFVRPLDAPEATPLAGTENARDLAFSPDGQAITFVANGKLRKVSLIGGSPQTICEAGSSRGVAWGADGTIVFAPTVNEALWRVSALGGSPQPVTTLAAGGMERSHRWPEVLPDGRTVLFTVGTPAKPGDYEDSAIDAVSLVSGRRWRVLSGASMARYLSGGHLIVSRLGTLSMVPFDLATGQVGGASVPVLEGVAGQPRSGVSYFSLSARGDLVFVSGFAGERARQLVRIGHDGKSTPLGLPSGLYRSVRVSPDGSRIAYSEGPGGGGRLDVWICELSRMNTYRLTSEGDGGSPVWTPDGRTVVWVPPSGNAVVRRAVDGSGGPQEVWRTEEAGILSSSAISPDGATLLLAHYGVPTKAHILALPLSGTPAVKALFETAANDDEPLLSPDGRWLAYVGEDVSGFPQVYVQAYPNAGGRWSITQGAGPMGGTSPRWSRDGRELYFIQNDLTLWAVPVTLQPEFAVGPPEKVTPVPDVVSRNLGESRYDVLPGKHEFVLIVAEKPTGPPPSLEVLLDWPAELRARTAGDGSRP